MGVAKILSHGEMAHLQDLQSFWISSRKSAPEQFLMHQNWTKINYFLAATRHLRGAELVL